MYGAFTCVWFHAELASNWSRNFDVREERKIWNLVLAAPQQ